MRIAIPSTGKEPTSPLSDTLGRAPFIIVYDSVTERYNSVKNPGFQMQDGSGLKASEIILEKQANILLTRGIGRKSYSALLKEYIKIELIKSGGTVKSALSKYFKEQRKKN